jgi:hypothetical protein
VASQRLITHADAVSLDDEAGAVIDAYLTDLAYRLPRHSPLSARFRAELRDDLAEATAAQLPATPGPAAAARAAIAEFGDAETVAAAFRPELATRQARRMGIALLASGPAVGACWLAATIFAADVATPWRWLPVLAAPLIILGAPATALIVASTGRLTRWQRPNTELATRAVVVAGAAAGAGDLALLLGSAALLLTAVPGPSPLVFLAAAASVTRLVFVGRTAMRLLASRGPVPPSAPA